MSKQVTLPILQAGQTAAELALLNPIGFERQLVFETDTLKAKLLNGVTAYNSLPYLFTSASVVWGGIDGILANQSDLQNALNAKQETLVSQTNIKSINGVSLLGSGDLVVGGAVDSVNGQTGVVALYTDDIPEVSNYRYVTDAQLTVIGNTSGVNTGDQDLSPYLTISSAASTYLALSGGTLTGNVSLGANQLTVHNIRPDASDGLLLESNNGTDIALLGAGNTANGTWYGNHNFEGGTIQIGKTATNTLGKLVLFGSTSGQVTIQPNAIAGTNIVLTAPATTGTIALTSDLSSYVPYTGASSAVNLGANNLTTTGKLTIGSSSSTYIFNVGAGTIKAYYNPNTIQNKLYIGTESNHAIGFATNDVERFTLQTNNNLTLLTTLLQFSGTTSAFPALKRSSTELQVRLADDSAFAPIQAAATTINGNLTVDTNTFFVDAANDFVGVGTTSQTVNERMNVRKDFNGVNRLVIQNATDGSASANSLRLISPTKVGLINLNAAGFTTAGMFQADSMYIYTNATNGMNIGSDSALLIKFWVNNAQVGAWTTGGLLAIGSGTTSSFPALKRSSTELQVRLADDSAFAPLQASQLTISAGNIITDTTTGMKIGTATSQKLGFWNATPIAQRVTSDADITSFVQNAGGNELYEASTWDSYTIGKIVTALRLYGILA